MTRGHCAATVEKAVKAADLKANVAVNLEAKTASIESRIGSDVFIAAIEDAGYRRPSRSPAAATSIDIQGNRNNRNAAVTEFEARPVRAEIASAGREREGGRPEEIAPTCCKVGDL
jgi:copper chaperone